MFLRQGKMDEVVKKTDGSKAAALPTVFTKELKVRFKEPGGAIFANNMVVQRDETVAYVTFYQVTPPILLGDDESQKKIAIDAIDTIEAIPAVRVAFPLNKLEALIDALKTVSETLGVK